MKEREGGREGGRTPTHSIQTAILQMSHSTIPFLLKTTQQELNKTNLQMLTKSSHYLFHGTVEIRDPQISKPLRRKRLTMQGRHQRKGGGCVLPSSCNIHPVNMTADKSLLSALQQQFSRLHNLKNK